ncbi:MAG TPA: DUF1028 domain-containing protein [Candidatus Saccharimonadales bacterium]|jgi:uncharacterized Ntn-hydrolase superfamily protein|nr:DUF1028 domain-containing protein [Candidatus Saccharimonadales bacterium]
MTFSIVGRSADGKSLGVAVASKFLAVGAYVPAAAVDAGALATQAYGNLALKTRGLGLLAQGIPAADMLRQFLRSDEQKEQRQMGVIDAQGRVVTFTGNRCMPWAGGRAEQSEKGSYAAQGNMLAGAHVVDAMVDSWLQSANDESLASRLIKSIAAGQVAGGDPRGKQAAAVLVVSKGKGYGGLSDVVVDLRCDDSPEPIAELERMLLIHELYFGSTPEDTLLALEGALSDEVRTLLKIVGYDSGDVARDLYNWMGRENFEERWHDDKIDPVVLEQLRSMSAKV